MSTYYWLLSYYCFMRIDIPLITVVYSQDTSHPPVGRKITIFLCWTRTLQLSTARREFKRRSVVPLRHPPCNSNTGAWDLAFDKCFSSLDSPNLSRGIWTPQWKYLNGGSEDWDVWRMWLSVVRDFEIPETPPETSLAKPQLLLQDSALIKYVTNLN